MCAFVQLRAFLQVSGAASFFGASGAEEVMKIFDSDGFVALCRCGCLFLRQSVPLTRCAETGI